MEFASFSERRLKYVTGLLIRAIVCAVFAVVFALNAYTASDHIRPHFLCAILILAILASLNGPFWVLGKRAEFPLNHFYVHWIVDLLAVTAVLHVLGGVELPYGSVGYMIMILTSAVFLSERASFVVAAASAVCFDGLVAAEYLKALPQYVYIWAHDYTGTAQLFIVLASDVFFFLFAYLAGSLAEQLKRANIALAKARDELTSYAATLEGKVQERTSALEIKSREVEEFVHIVTHDLRNVVVGAAEVARRLILVEGEHLSRKGRRYAENLLEDTKSMNSMLGSLLTLLRVDSEAGELAVTGVAEVIRDVLASYSERLEGRRVRLSVGEISAIEVNPVQFRHVLRNLIENAIKYTGDKAVPQIEIVATARDAEVVISIRDNGIGIASDQRDRIFDLYHRGPRQVVAGKEVEGHGVGLAMTKRMVQRWGGDIWLESELGVGSAFHFSCPSKGLWGESRGIG